MYRESGAKMLQSHCYLLVRGQQFIKKGLVERINEKLVAENQVFFYLEWLRDSVSLLLGGHWRAIIFCTFRGFAMQGSSPSILCESQGGSVWNLQKKKKKIKPRTLGIAHLRLVFCWLDNYLKKNLNFSHNVLVNGSFSLIWLTGFPQGELWMLRSTFSIG